jgi:hypothetical protein
MGFLCFWFLQKASFKFLKNHFSFISLLSVIKIGDLLDYLTFSEKKTNLSKNKTTFGLKR